MSRKGRGTELVVAQLEKILAGEEVEIKSPDSIFDNVAGVFREVDISLRSKIGSHDILIIIECRDRPSKEKEDVTWVEQVVTKTKDIMANKVVLVATTDFTTAAKNKAASNNIELRVLKDLALNDIKNWMDNLTMEFYYLKYDVMSVYVGMLPSNAPEIINQEKIGPVITPGRPSEEIKTSSKIFIIEPVGNRVSLDDIISSAKQLFDGINPNNEPVQKDFCFFFFDPLQRLFSENDGVLNRVFKIEISAKFWMESEKVSEISAKQYKSDSKVISERIDYNWNLKNGDELTLAVQRDLEAQKQNFLFFVKKGSDKNSDGASI